MIVDYTHSLNRAWKKDENDYMKEEFLSEPREFRIEDFDIDVKSPIRSIIFLLLPFVFMIIFFIFVIPILLYGSCNHLLPGNKLLAGAAEQVLGSLCNRVEP